MVRKSVNLDQKTIDSINKYRKRQPDLPNFSQAIIQIIEKYFAESEN